MQTTSSKALVPPIVLRFSVRIPALFFFSISEYISDSVS
jgi:hypothetical protein